MRSFCFIFLATRYFRGLRLAQRLDEQLQRAVLARGHGSVALLEGAKIAERRDDELAHGHGRLLGRAEIHEHGRRVLRGQRLAALGHARQVEGHDTEIQEG